MLMVHNPIEVFSERPMAARHGNACFSQMRIVVALISRWTHIIHRFSLPACGPLRSTPGAGKVVEPVVVFSSRLTAASLGSVFRAMVFQRARPGRSSLQLHPTTRNAFTL